VHVCVLKHGEGTAAASEALACGLASVLAEGRQDQVADEGREGLGRVGWGAQARVIGGCWWLRGGG
jgi:hypothetical protein